MAAQFEGLLSDRTRTYFEGQAQESHPAASSYSRDHRPDCHQVVRALVITPEGFPVGDEIDPGNTSDKTTLPVFMKKAVWRNLWVIPLKSAA